MTREIKFRGKRVDNGEWVYGFYLVCVDVRERQMPYGEPIEIVKTPIIYCEDGNSYEVIPESVGQSTGLFDKNNKEVFEGDKVKVGYCDDFYSEGIYCCVWHNGGLLLTNSEDEIVFPMLFCQHPEWYEIIGNIHDNPSLLEV